MSSSNQFFPVFLALRIFTEIDCLLSIFNLLIFSKALFASFCNCCTISHMFQLCFL